MRTRRSDLQGLRALAVAGVVAYHFNIPPFSGGFVGVDVFFVLSGYFIVRALLSEAMETGHIDLLRFWANRVKRLMPNGMLVIAVTICVALIVFPTYRFQTVLSDALYSALFAANFHFAFSAIDYFQIGAPPSPLLHFWSLSVEEQFYLAAPLALWALIAVNRKRSPRKVFIGALIAIAAASFLASLSEISTNQPAAFFLSPYRAWQLAVGGLIGVSGLSSSTRNGPVLGLGAWLGSFLIIGAYVLVSDNVIYPGYWALLPTIGASLILLGLDGAGAGHLRRALSVPLLVRLGNASYSVYLWHWPVAVFLTTAWPEGGLLATSIGLVLTAFLSAIAYKYFEKPIHDLQLAEVGIGRTFIIGASATTLLVAATVGAAGLPGRTDRGIAEQIETASNDVGPNYSNGCHLNYDETDQPICLVGDQKNPRVVLFGDSHAAQWFNAVERAAADQGWSMQSWTKSSCPAVQVTIWYAPKQAPYLECDKWRSERMADLLENPPALVILGSSSRYDEWLNDPESNGQASPERAGLLWTEGTERIARMLIEHGIQTVQLVDTPSMNDDFQLCLSERAWDTCGRARAAALAGLPASDSLDSLDLTTQLCGPTRCEAVLDGEIIYRDQYHITATTAGLSTAEQNPANGRRNSRPLLAQAWDRREGVARAGVSYLGGDFSRGFSRLFGRGFERGDSCRHSSREC